MLEIGVSIPTVGGGNGRWTLNSQGMQEHLLGVVMGGMDRIHDRVVP